jgi:DnaJ-class molecular chaperone
MSRKGLGEVMSDKLKCDECNGTGKITTHNANYHAEERNCVHCRGTGKLRPDQIKWWKIETDNDTN